MSYPVHSPMFRDVRSLILLKSSVWFVKPTHHWVDWILAQKFNDPLSVLACSCPGLALSTPHYPETTAQKH